MTTRSAFPLFLLLGLLPGCAAPGGGARHGAGVFACPRKGFSIAYTPPAGWTGPVYTSGPALDSWTFSSGPATTADSLETRVYDARDSLVHWDTASDKEILANFQGTYVNPRIERTATVPIDGHPTLVRAVHSTGVEEYLATVYRGDSLVQVMFTTATPDELARQRAVFLAFVQSLSFEKTP